MSSSVVGVGFRRRAIGEARQPVEIADNISSRVIIVEKAGKPRLRISEFQDLRRT